MPAIVVVGLGFGDESKGAVVDHLARQHKASGVVLFNGGAQRAHNVVLPDGRHHTFSQFSSGSLTGAKTFHSRYSLINPHAFFNEGQKLAEQCGIYPWNLVRVQEDAVITTPFHVALNRFREHARAVKGESHGTCGMGIGETVLDAKNGYAIYASDLLNPKVLYEKLHDTQARLKKIAYSIAAQLNSQVFVTDPAFFEYAAIKDCMEIYRIFAKVVPQFEDFIAEFTWESDETYIFEGSQGALLHEKYGFHPHTTWSDTSHANATRLLDGYTDEFKVIGVMRSYMTRHGAGPFPTEDASLLERFTEPHNGAEGYQGAWRVGWSDLYAIQRGIHINSGIDELAVTHLDSVQGDWKICTGYGREMGLPATGDREEWERWQARILDYMENRAVPEYLEFNDMDADTLLGYISAYLDVPITITGHGPTHDDYRASVPA